MAAHDGIPKALQHAPCGTSPWVTIDTVFTWRLYLWVFARKPSRLINIIEHRGSRSRQRYFYYTQDHVCIPEHNYFTGLTHTWQLPTHALGTDVWLVYADSCDPHHITFTSPPWKYTYNACPVGVGYLLCQEDVDQSPPALPFSVIQMGNDVDGNSLLRNDSFSFKADRAGTWRVTNYCTLLGNSSGPVIGQARIRKTNAPTADLVTQQFTIPTSSAILFQMSAESVLAINDTVGVQFGQLSGGSYTIVNVPRPNMNVFQFA